MLIKYINSVLWREAKRLSYIEDARCLKLKRLISYFEFIYSKLIINNFKNLSIFTILEVLVSSSMGVRVGAIGRGTALKPGRSLVLFPMVSLEFFIDIILPAAL